MMGGPGGAMGGRGGRGGRDGEGWQGGGQRRPDGQAGPRLSPKQILEKFDADKDGKLSESELEAFLKAGRGHRQGPPPGDDQDGQRNGPPPQSQDKDK